MIRDVETLPAHVDLAIVGAGPAGLAASATAARLALSVLMLDENPNVGGQIYRAITANPVRDHALLGADYWRGAAADSQRFRFGELFPHLGLQRQWVVHRRPRGGQLYVVAQFVLRN